MRLTCHQNQMTYWTVFTSIRDAAQHKRLTQTCPPWSTSRTLDPHDSEHATIAPPPDTSSQLITIQCHFHLIIDACIICQMSHPSSNRRLGDSRKSVCTIDVVKMCRVHEWATFESPRNEHEMGPGPLLVWSCVVNNGGQPPRL